jgi:hypothetical protein
MAISPQDAEKSYNDANTFLKRQAKVLVDTRVPSGYKSLPDGAEISKEEAYKRIQDAGGTPENILARMPGTPEFKDLPPPENPEPTNSSSKTAGDAVNPQTDGTGKDSSTNSTKETLSKEEKQNIENSKNSSTDTSTAVVTDNKTSNGQAPSQANEEAKQGLFATPQYGEPAVAKNTDISVGGTKAEDKAKPPARINISPNPLHAYATYTYSLSLHLLTPESYNKMANGEDWLPEAKTLIAGGGRWGTDRTDKNTFHRAAQFKDDFYFDGLSLDTIIGMNAQSRGANAIQFKFNIVEPYGFTLINRLLDLSIEMKQPNYLTNPYVLQIDFFGNNDAGEPVHPLTDKNGRSMSKFLPCKIIEMKIKVGTSGATYACVAIPYSHAAFAETVGVTPANFEVVASTVGNFFTNDADDSALIKAVEERQRQSDNAQQNMKWAQVMANTKEGGATAADKEKLEQQAKKNAAAANAPFKAKSYTGAYNAYQQYLVLKKHCKHPVKIKFSIHPEIADAQIVVPEKNSPSTTPAVDTTDKKETTAAVSANKAGTTGKPAVASVKTDVARFNVNAGDQILELINKVMRSSTYITNQLKDKDPVIKNNDEGAPVDKDGKPLKWFKVIPKLILTDFDLKRNDWGAEITYHIVPYEYQNSKHPGVARSDDNQIRKNLRKKYSYIYSGENNDILDFSIDFNTIFYTAVKVLSENTARLGAAPDNPGGDTSDNPETEGDAPDQQTKVVNPNVTHPISVDKGAAGGINASTNPAAQQAADVMKSIYSSSRGDMINVKLKIVGDPDFIKTDDVYYNPGNANYPGPDETHAPDGSILTDRGDIFALLSWRTPADLDQETGLPDFTRFQNSVFDGVYKIIKVSCEFKGGNFEQTLDMIRFHDGVKDVIEAEGIEQRGKRNATTNTKEEITAENKNASKEKELPEGSRKATDAASLRAAQDAARGNETDQGQNAKLASVAENGNEKTAEQQSTDNNNSQDNTNPTNSDQPTQQQQKLTPQGGNAELAGKTVTTQDGYTVTYSSAGFASKSVSPTGEEKYFDDLGNQTAPPAGAKDPEIAQLQKQYEDARYQSQSLERTRKRTETNPAYGDEYVGPGGREKQLARLDKQIQDQQAEMAALEAQLKDRGAGVK